MMAGSTAVEAFAGIGAVVLTILSLSKVYPLLFTSIATIAVGFAFLMQGTAISANYSTLLEDATRDQSQAVEFTGGMTTEFIGGIGGIVLGILSLIGVDPATLLPIAALVFGGILALGTGDAVQLTALRNSGDDDTRDIINSAIRSSAGAQLLVGLGSIALGIIALAVAGSNKLLLSTIAILSVAAMEFSRGTASAPKCGGFRGIRR
jgi:hypothetical protein